MRIECEKTGPEPVGAEGRGRLYVDNQRVAEGETAKTATVGYTMADLGHRLGQRQPVCEDYQPTVSSPAPSSRSTSTYTRTTPRLPDNDAHAHGRVQHAMLRQYAGG